MDKHTPDLGGGLIESCKGTVKGIFAGLLDLVYPPKCLVCDDMQAKYLCDTCILEINNLEPPVCHRCGIPMSENRCTECADVNFAFDSARAVGEYDGVLKEAIHKLKYSGHRVMAPALGALLVELLHSKHAGYLRQCECIVPIPIHPSRLKMRGFNQSELLAMEVAHSFGIPMVTNAVVRYRPTNPQVNLPLDERHENVRNAFEVVRKEDIAGKRVLLVDDVFTTGSTLDAAAQVIRDAGAKEVHVLTVAHSL